MRSIVDYLIINIRIRATSSHQLGEEQAKIGFLNHSPELCEFMHVLWGAGNEKSLKSYDFRL